MPPEPINIHAGAADGDLKAKIGKEGARTIPGRPEHGGNCEFVLPNARRMRGVC